ncbi:MAG: bacillithiol biosynthesis deacetylase BshB1 [Candidatus Zixiibacteriota bacterium]
MEYDLISIGAHPDDVEVGTGGVLIGLNKAGYKTAIVYLTKGEMGTGGTPELRHREAQDAANLIGSDLLQTFDWGDCRLVDNYDHRLNIATLIRQYKPKIILAPYPHLGHGRRQSHPDHIAAGEIVINAANYATLKKLPIEGEPHLVSKVFHYFLPPKVAPDFVVDITEHFDKWIECLKCHQSQFMNPEKSKDYIWTLENYARSFGSQAGCKYGQGFKAVEPIKVADIFDLIK